MVEELPNSDDDFEEVMQQWFLRGIRGDFLEIPLHAGN